MFPAKNFHVHIDEGERSEIHFPDILSMSEIRPSHNRIFFQKILTRVYVQEQTIDEHTENRSHAGMGIPITEGKR